MTKDIVVGDELPDWVGAKEFYQKYDPKEVIGRWVLLQKPHNLVVPCIVNFVTQNVFQGG